MHTDTGIACVASIHLCSEVFLHRHVCMCTYDMHRLGVYAVSVHVCICMCICTYLDHYIHI